MFNSFVITYSLYKSNQFEIKMASQKGKQAQYRENMMGTDFISCPPQQCKRVFITGEILSAQDFPTSQLFISYKISLPVGWKSEIPESAHDLDLTPQQLKQLNCLESISHSVSPVVLKNQQGVSINKFYFCFPIDLQLIAFEGKYRQWPTIHFQVYSKDFWDRVFMHGCGFIRIPNTQGTHTIAAPTWKPMLDIKSKVTQFFLGGMIRPKHIEDISKSQSVNQMDNPGPINRMLYDSISGGTVNFRLNVASQSKKVKTDERVNYKAFKFSQQIQAKKSEMPSNIPSLVNTGTVLGGRFTNARLN